MQKTFLLSFLIFFSLNAAEVVKLKIPDLSPNKITRYSTGIRPCRTSGIRLEAEQRNNKLIIHDYGHGGSGISLSWGCALEAIRIMQQHTSDHKPIAIIGAGVIGLSTAHLLKDQGYDVTVYSHDFVPFTTSNKAAGLWSPNFGSNLADKEQYYRIYNFSYAKFYDLSTDPNPLFNGVFQLPRYSEKPEYKATDALPENCVVVDLNGTQKVCKKIITYIFDLNIYLQDLFEKAQKKHIAFVHKDFESVDDLAALPESIIFNCTGLGSRELFNDTELYGTKGHIVIYEAQPEMDYVICNHHQKQDLFFSLIPWQTQLVLGGTLEKDVEDISIDQDKINCLLAQAHEFFNPQ